MRLKLMRKPAAGAKVVELSIDTVAFVYGEYAKHVAAKSLEEALDKFGPSMVKISALVKAQVADARRLFVEQIQAQVQELKSGAVGMGTGSRKKTELSEKQNTATAQLLALTPPPSSADQQRSMMSRATLAQLETASSRSPRIWPSTTRKSRRSANARRPGSRYSGPRRMRSLAWGVAHQQLVQAVKERKPVNVDSLLAAVAEVRTLSQRWREL